MNLSHLGQIDETDHDLDHLRSSPAVARGSAGSVQYRSIQIQPRKPVLDHADYTAPTRQHERNQTDQEYACRERSTSRSVACAVCARVSARLCSHMKRAISCAARQTVRPVLARVCPSSGFTPVSAMETCKRSRARGGGTRRR